MILEIHEITSEILNCDLSDPEIEAITFDDGLYTQFLNYKHFLQFKKPLYYFISPAIIGKPEFQNSDLIECWRAHEIFFKTGRTDYYMSWDNIKELSEVAEIGGHTFSHPNLRGLKLTEQLKIAKEQIDLMIQAFKDHNIKIESFAYPYDYEFFGFKFLLKKHGIKKLFGENRITIENYMLKNLDC